MTVGAAERPNHRNGRNKVPKAQEIKHPGSRRGVAVIRSIEKGPPQNGHDPTLRWARAAIYWTALLSLGGRSQLL